MLMTLDDKDFPKGRVTGSRPFGRNFKKLGWIEGPQYPGPSTAGLPVTPRIGFGH